MLLLILAWHKHIIQVHDNSWNCLQDAFHYSLKNCRNWEYTQQKTVVSNSKDLLWVFITTYYFESLPNSVDMLGSYPALWSICLQKGPRTNLQNEGGILLQLWSCIDRELLIQADMHSLVVTLQDRDNGSCPICNQLNDAFAFHDYRRIDCEQIHSRINQQLIAGRFGHEGLRQLRTKLKDTQCETYLYS